MAAIALRTERLALRHYTLDDLDAVQRMFSDEYARRFYPGMAAPEQARGWIERNIARCESDGFGLWAVEHDNTLVGDCGLTQQSTDDGTFLEIGYHLLTGHRGRGFATEAARACLAHAFETLNAELVVSIVHPENAASIAVASRVHTHARATSQSGQPRRLFYTERAQ